MNESSRVGIDISSTYSGKGTEQALADQKRLQEAAQKNQAYLEDVAKRREQNQRSAAESDSRRAASARAAGEAEVKAANESNYALTNLIEKLGSASLGQQALAGDTLQAVAATGAFGAALAGVIAVSVAGIAANEKWNRALNSTNTLFIASGRSAEVSRGQIASLVLEIEKAANMNRAGAFATVSTLSQMPNLSGGMISDLARMNTDFASATGRDPASSARALGAAFSDPIKGARELDSALNILSADQLILIERMTQQGRTMEAQQILYDAMKGRIEGLTNAGLTPLQAAFNNLGNSWNNLWNNFQNSPEFKNAENRISRMVGWIGAILDSFSDPDGELTLSGARTKSRKSGPRGPNAAAALEEQVKQALAAGEAYDNVGRRQRELTDTATRLRSAMGGLEEAGRGNTDSYGRLKAQLAGVNRELAEIGRRPTREIDTAIATMGRDTAKQAYQLEYMATHGRLPQDTAEIEAKFETGDPTGRFYRFSQAKKTQYIGAAQAKDQGAEQIRLRTSLMQQEMTIQAELLDGVEAIAAARKAESDALSHQWQASILYVEELNFQNSLMGKSSFEQRKLTELRKIDQMVTQLGLGKSQAFKESLEGVAETMRRGVTAALEENQKQMESWQVGANAAVTKYGEGIRNVAAATEGAFTRTFNSLENDIVSSLRKGELSFKSFGDTAVNELLRIQVQTQFMAPLIGTAAAPGILTQGLSGLFGRGGGSSSSVGGGGSTPGLSGFESHGGSGPGDALMRRFVHPAYFDNAPRAHTGIGPNERPVVITNDESVLTPGQMRAMGGSRNVRVEIVNSGAPKDVQEVQPSFDAHGMLLRVMLDDARSNGPITRSVGQTFGLRRR